MENMLHPTTKTTILPSNPPRNDFTQYRNDLTTEASENCHKRRETITGSSPPKRSFQELLDAAIKVALSDNSEPAKAVACASDESPTPVKVTTPVSIENFTPEKATALASREHSMTVEVAPSASSENATQAEVAVFASLWNISTAELDPCASSEHATQAEVTVCASVQNNPSTKLAPAVLGDNLPRASTCSEDPHFFSGLNYIDSLLSLANISEATHSEITRPCQRRSAHHEEPYHVCLDCRNLAARHIQKMTPELMMTKFLAMCNECGKKAVEELMLNLSTSHSQRLGCRCSVEWLCCQCKIETYELASAKFDAEIEWRSDIVPLRDAEYGLHCNFSALRCRCGKYVEIDSVVYRCVGCEELEVC